MKRCYWCAKLTTAGMHSYCWKRMIEFCMSGKDLPDLFDYNPEA